MGSAHTNTGLFTLPVCSVLTTVSPVLNTVNLQSKD